MPCENGLVNVRPPSWMLSIWALHHCEWLFSKTHSDVSPIPMSREVDAAVVKAAVKMVNIALSTFAVSLCENKK